MKETRPVCGEEEELFRMEGGRITEHVLPGERAAEGDGYLRIRRDAYIYMEAGAGNIPGRDGRIWGGFCAFSCAMFSPRRFAIRHGEELRAGKTPEEILGALMREEIRDAIRESTGKRTELTAEEEKEIWNEIGRRWKKRAADAGWTAEGLRPGRIRVRKEV